MRRDPPRFSGGMRTHYRRQCRMQYALRWICVLGATLFWGVSQGAVLFGASAGSADGSGHLYAIDPENARVRDVGPIQIDGKIPVGVNGIAMHPTQRVLYGITTERKPRVVKIDATDAKAQVVSTLRGEV